MAHIAQCPGDAPIVDGKINGNRVSFIVIGKYPWQSWGTGWQSSGHDRLKFTGIVRGSEIKLALIWDSALIYGTRKPKAMKLEMTGKKIPEA